MTATCTFIKCKEGGTHVYTLWGFYVMSFTGAVVKWSLELGALRNVSQKSVRFYNIMVFSIFHERIYVA